MPITTHTINDPRAQQQQNLQLFNQINQLGQTLAGSFQQYQQQKLLQKQAEQQAERQRFAIGIKLYNKSLEAKDANTLQKSLTDYLGFTEEEALNTVKGVFGSISIGNTKKALAFENIGNLLGEGTYRNSEGKKISVPIEQLPALTIATLSASQIAPEKWGSTLKSIYGVKAFTEANMIYNNVLDQEMLNLNKAKQNNPQLDVEAQIESISTRIGIQKAKSYAALAGIKLESDFGEKFIQKYEYQDALRKQSLGKTLDPYEMELVNKPREMQLELKKTETEIAYKQAQIEKLKQEPVNKKELANKTDDELLALKNTILKDIENIGKPGFEEVIAAMTGTESPKQKKSDIPGKRTEILNQRLETINFEIVKRDLKKYPIEQLKAIMKDYTSLPDEEKKRRLDHPKFGPLIKAMLENSSKYIK